MARPFLETLGELRQGRTLEELGLELANVVAAVQATSKKGSLSLKITVSPPKKGSATYLVVDDEIVTRVPKLDRAETVFFPTRDHSLSRNDPSQIPLGLRPVEPPVIQPPFDKSTGEIHTGTPA